MVDYHPVTKMPDGYRWATDDEVEDFLMNGWPEHVVAVHVDLLGEPDAADYAVPVRWEVDD